MSNFTLVSFTFNLTLYNPSNKLCILSFILSLILNKEKKKKASEKESNVTQISRAPVYVSTGQTLVLN
jgi:hypothetical protein